MKKVIRVLLGYCISAGLIMQCSSPGWNARKYYFPLKDLKDGLVYVYENEGNLGAKTVYWYYRSIIGAEGVFLTAAYYENQSAPTQIVTEELVSNGMMRRELFLLEEGQDGRSQRTQATIEVGDTYPFYIAQKGSIFLQRQFWKGSNSGHKTTLIKNRIFEGDTTFEWQGKNRSALHWRVKELLIDEGDGDLELAFDGTEIYTEGVGLTFYSKEVSKGMIMAYRLKELISMEELTERLLLY